MPDRALAVGTFLDNWLVAKKLELKPRTYDSYAEAVTLYFRPGIGHLRLVDLRDFHLQELVQEMLVRDGEPFGNLLAEHPGVA